MSNLKKHLHHEKGFTTIDNGIFFRRELDLRAIGLLIQLLSLPDDWKYSIKGLVKICKDGESSIKTGLDQLKQYGYLTVERARREKGQLGEAIYHIYDNPEDNEDFQKKMEKKIAAAEIIDDETVSDDSSHNKTIIETDEFAETVKFTDAQKNKKVDSSEGETLETLDTTAFTPVGRFDLQADLTPSPEGRFPDMENHNLGNHNLGIHNLENQTQYNTNIYKKNKYNKNINKDENFTNKFNYYNWMWK